MFTKQKQRGIILGVLSGILFATLLNWQFDWQFLALGLGVLTGLEVGFWTGIPALTLQIHQTAFQKTFSRQGLNFLWQTLVIVGVSCLVIASMLAAYVVPIFLQHLTPPLLADTYGISNIFPNAGSGNFIPSTHLGGFAGLVMWFGCIVVLKKFLRNISVDRLWIVWLLVIPAGVLIGAITYWLSLVIITLVGTAFVLSLATVITYILYSFLRDGLVALCKTAVHNQAATITVGVISGVISGLGFGIWWTKFAFGPTMLSCLLGCSVGYSLAYATHKVGSSTWFQAKYLPTQSSC